MFLRMRRPWSELVFFYVRTQMKLPMYQLSQNPDYPWITEQGSSNP